MPSRVLARLAVALAAIVLIAFAWLRLEAADQGVRVSQHQVGSTPVTAFTPQASQGAQPVVVIAHGFAGSQQLMQPFALTLARRGFLVLTFDFPGHGRNTAPLSSDPGDFATGRRALLEALAEIAAAARHWPGSDGRLALLGHSLAADIVIRQAMADDAVHAAVALSAYSPVVTANSPRNLLIVDGEFEPRMLHDEGLRLVSLALGGAPAVSGRTYGDFAAGTARRFALADGVEHVSLLYSRTALIEALDWIEHSLGTPSVAGPRLPDDRGRWLALLYLGLIALAWPLAALLPRVVVAAVPVRIRHRVVADEPLELPSISALDILPGQAVACDAKVAMSPISPPSQAALGANPWRPVRRDTAVAVRAVPAGGRHAMLGWRDFWPVAVLPALLTPLLLWRLPGGVLPLLLGDYLTLHFAVYGATTAVALWLVHARRSPFTGLQPLALTFAAVAAALYAVFAFGVPLDRHVTSFAPVGGRGLLGIAVFCGTLPYFLADEWLVRGTSRARGGYAFTKLMFLVSLGFAIALNPGRLYFLAIVMSVILVAFVIHGLLARWVFLSTGHPWAGACAGAAAFAWLIAATFPVVAP